MRSLGRHYLNQHIGSTHIPLISDDARICVQQRRDFWIARVNGTEVIDCGLVWRFDSEVAAVRTALAKSREAHPAGWHHRVLGFKARQRNLHLATLAELEEFRGNTNLDLGDRDRGSQRKLHGMPRNHAHRAAKAPTDRWPALIRTGV